MSTFTLRLQDARTTEDIEGVVAFMGEDRSGSFSLWANHERSLTVLSPGLSRFRIHNDPWQYLALPGGLLYFHNNQLTISARRFFRSDDYQQVEHVLHDRILTEEETLHSIKTSLHRMEDTLLQRMYELGREGQ